ncbi:hypothetical protein GJAV_G00196200 [Gymnothorax javanicus]|nr:hypothetical protein GJAV_G00196200 [Gymnothorax javanicus]
MEERERERGVEQNPLQEPTSSTHDDAEREHDISAGEEYESFLKGGRGRAKPENVEKRLRKAKKGVPDPERIERLKKLMVNAEPDDEEGSSRKRPQRKRKAVKNILTRMPLHAGSPLGELYRCVQEKIRVKVHIRTFKGLRGVCSGFVVAFDKFWNLAMVDVDETYRKPLLGEALYHEKALTVTRLFDRLKLQETGATDEPPTQIAPGPAPPHPCVAPPGRAWGEASGQVRGSQKRGLRVRAPGQLSSSEKQHLAPEWTIRGCTRGT